MTKKAATALLANITGGRLASYVSQIKETLNVLKECNKDLSDLKNRKKRLATNGIDEG